MKQDIILKIVCALVVAGTAVGCQSAAQTVQTNVNKTAAVEKPVQTAAAQVPEKNVVSKSPTEAYRNLYNAVQAKDLGALRALMSKNTIGLAEFASQTQKVGVEQVLANGFLAANKSEKMPQTRDERINGDFGALEVQKPDGGWEDAPFIKEDGSWKLAVGDQFRGAFRSPGRPKAAANANTAAPQVITPVSPSQMNNAPVKTINMNDAVIVNKNVGNSKKAENSGSNKP